MKKHLLRIFIACCVQFTCWASLNAQWVTIPDANFIDWLNDNCPQCLNGNQLDTTCPYILSYTIFNSSNSNIQDYTGIQYFDSLRVLNCSSSTENLPALPPLLEYLHCSNSLLNSLPELPQTLLDLSCSNNSLDSLPALPPRLTYLNCSYNSIKNLPALPNSLSVLECRSDSLSFLPPLPDSLTILWCTENQLTGLPILPPNLSELLCGNNQITTLPVFPDGLDKLECGGNLLTSLPALPKGLTNLSCPINQLTSLPDFPDSLYTCYINDNPITCLPWLKRLVDINYSNTSIRCMPNAGNVSILIALPLCDSTAFTNPNNCAYCGAYFKVKQVLWNAGYNYTYNQGGGAWPYTTSYLWDFGDGVTSTYRYTTHIYANPGKYNVCLTVNSASCSHTYCDSTFTNATTLEIVCPYQTYAHYTLYRDTTTPHHWFALNQSQSNYPLSYVWQWGDGDTSIGTAVSHTYSAPGNYNVCLTAYDSQGCFSTYCDSSTYIYKTDESISIDVVGELPTGIQRAQKISAIDISPNPSQNQISIACDKSLLSANLNIYNSTGALINSTQLTTTNINLDVSNYPAGMYIAEVKLHNKVERIKWIKM